MFTNVDNFKTVEIVRYLDKAGAGGEGDIHIHLSNNMRFLYLCPFIFKPTGLFDLDFKQFSFVNDYYNTTSNNYWYCTQVWGPLII